jgi:P-type Cu+ transporter
MHPQIRRSEPWSCPICGMTLEPLQPAVETGPSPELRDITRRFWIGTVFALPVVILDMAGDIRALNLHRLVPPVASM